MGLPGVYSWWEGNVDENLKSDSLGQAPEGIPPEKSVDPGG